jgi:hypothetical protein
MNDDVIEMPDDDWLDWLHHRKIFTPEEKKERHKRFFEELKRLFNE